MILATVLSLAAVAVVAAFVSTVCGGLVWGLDRLDRVVTAAARARLLLVVAVAPLVVAFTVVGVALAPSVGLGLDHCFAHVGHHAHLCFTHAPAELGILPGALAAWLLLRFAARSWSTSRLIVRSHRAGTGLQTEAIAPRDDAEMNATVLDATVLDEDEPYAFVLGWLRPRVFVTRGLLADDSDDQLAAVLAHENAHRRRRDPLRRLLAGLAVAFHLPWIGSRIERRLALSNEMAADERAAHEVGDRTLVAEVLVRHARLQALVPQGALALGGADVAARVTALLNDDRRAETPTSSTLGALVIVALGIVVAFAHSLHHALELALGHLLLF